MAKVILSEGYRNPMLANKPVMLSGFFDNLFDDLGDFGSNLTGFVSDLPAYAHNITGAAVNSAGQIVSNPNLVAGIVGGAFGIPTGFGLPAGQQQPQPQSDNPLENPIVLMGGAALLIYLLMKK
jgi:hypothetical protein